MYNVNLNKTLIYREPRFTADVSAFPPKLRGKSRFYCILQYLISKIQNDVVSYPRRLRFVSCYSAEDSADDIQQPHHFLIGPYIRLLGLDNIMDVMTNFWWVTFSTAKFPPSGIISVGRGRWSNFSVTPVLIAGHWSGRIYIVSSFFSI